VVRLLYKTRDNAAVEPTSEIARTSDLGDPDDDTEMYAYISKQALKYAETVFAATEGGDWRTWVDGYCHYRHVEADAAIRNAIRRTREHCAGEIGGAKREFELMHRELAVSLREQVIENGRAVREEAKAAREQQEEKDALARYEIGVVRRELATLREEVALERGFQVLKAEIAVAKAEIPRLPEIEARVDAKQSKLAAEQKRLEQELAKQKDRLGRLRVDQSVTAFSVKKLEEARKPIVELKFVTEDGCCFSLKDAHPDAIETWRKFAHELVAANSGTMFSHDPSNVISMPVRKNGNAA
jgi:hypothetical protein